MWLELVTAVLLCQAPTQSAPDWQAEGLKALEAKDYTAAIAALQKAAAADPKDVAAQYYLGVAYELSNNDAEAAAHYRRAIELKPDLYEANLNLGGLLVRMRQAEPAIPLLRNASAAKPSDPRPLVYLGAASLAAGDLEAARGAYESALRLDSTSADAEAGIAQVYVRLNRLDDAAPHFERAAQLDPSRRDLLLDLADSYEAAQRGPDALRIYRQFPEHPEAQRRIGMAFLRDRQYENALPHLEAAERLGPAAETREALAFAYQELGQLEKAARTLDRALSDAPSNFDLRMAAGRLARLRKDYTVAETHLRAAASLKPRDLEAWHALAAIANLQVAAAGADPKGPRAEALLHSLRLMAEALDRARDLGGEQQKGHVFLRAKLLDHLHDYKGALEYYQRFLSMSGSPLPDEEILARSRIVALKRMVRR